ncbi:MAG: hypothetical protein MH137_06290 [Flavobacteriales bacterium]|nr:hypothetical protein [Flavobacteriales bacterium]
MNIKLFLSRYLFPIILLVVSIMLLVVGIKPGQTQSAAFLIAAVFLLVSSVLMILASAEIIKGKTASIIGLIMIPVAGYLAFQNVNVVQSDIEFKNQSNFRYGVVRERLEKIREAQVAYRNEKGQFAEDFDVLIEFVRNGQMKIIKKVGNEDDSLQVALGKVRRDTVFVPVLGNGFNPANYPIDSLKYIPYGQGQMFNLAAGILGAEGAEYRPPVFEASANFKTFMSDLGTKYGKVVPDSVIKVGSMIEPTTNGNWK